jgi:SAM-dependent methyltransferase
MDGRDVLRRFHARLPGASRGVFGAGGPSYRRLADAIALARRRLGDSVPLHLADARALPLPDAAFATVVSHMAFMFMRPIEETVAEVARVLRRGGRFVATVGRQGDRNEAERLFFRKLMELLRRENAAIVDLWDDRTGEVAGLSSLFPAPTWTGFAHEDFAFSVPVDAAAVGDWLEAAFYPVDLLSPAGRAELRAWIDAERALLAPGGTMTWTFAARQFVVVRK